MITPARRMPKSPDVVRIGAYQGPTEPGALDQNAQVALDRLAEARRMRVDFACLPECFLSGYGEPDLIKAASVSTRGPWFRKWLARCSFGDMVVIIGFMEKEGARHHNSAAIIQRGRLLGVYRKSVAGSPYEKQIVTYVSRFPVFKALGVTFGVIICFESAFREPCLILAEKGARIIFAPHYAYIPMKGVDSHLKQVRNNHIARAVENGCWIVKANTVTPPCQRMGRVEGFGYGDSFVLDALGLSRAEAGLFTTGWITADAPRRELTGKWESRVRLLPKATRRQAAEIY